MKRHPPKAEACAQRVMKQRVNTWLDGKSVLSRDLIDETVASATAQTETALDTMVAAANDQINTCTANLRGYTKDLPNCSPYQREQTMSYMKRDFQTVKEAKVRRKIYERARSDVGEGGCKQQTVQNTNCRNANLSFVDYCSQHAP